MSLARIRSATVEDAATIAMIHVVTWQIAYANLFPSAYLASLSIDQRTESWRQLLTENQHTTLVAEVDSSIVGWTSGGVSRDEDGQGISELHALYVLPAFWGTGIADQLVRGIERVFRQGGEATLWVLRDNHRAIRFHKKAGYRADGKEAELERGGVRLHEIRLRKKIDARNAASIIAQVAV